MTLKKDIWTMAIYLDVRDDLYDKITSGVYKSGDKIPSERELSETYSVSRMTVRQAINVLVKDGVVYREKGRGTFVSVPNLYQDNMKSFTQTLIEQNMHPTTKVIEASMVTHLKSISQILHMDPRTSYYKIKRLRLGDNVPIALETVYIPTKYVPGLLDHSLEHSLYQVLEEQYGYEMTNIACEIEACISNKILMGVMELKNQEGLLKITGITYDQNGRRIFYEESYYRSDLYKYRVDILGRQ